MHAHVVEFSYIIESHLAILVNIQFVVGLSDHTNSSRAQISSKSADEFIKGHTAAAVTIKFSEKSLGLLLVEVDSKVFEAVHELSHVDLSISIIVNNSEDTAQGTDGHRSTAQESSLDVSHDSIGIIFLLLNHSISRRVLG